MDKKTIKKNITSYWDKLADKYDTYVRRGILTYEEKINWYKTLLDLLSDRPLKILDVGSGTGNMSILLSQLGHSVTGIDLSRKSLSIAKRKSFKLPNKPEFIYADAVYPPFDENSFDVIFNRYLVWTLIDPDQTFSAWYRILKPHGKLIIIDGLWNNNSLKSRKLSGYNLYMEKIFNFLPLYLPPDDKSLKIIKNSVKQSGFRNIRFNKIENIDHIHQQLDSSLQPHYVLIAYKKRLLRKDLTGL